VKSKLAWLYFNVTLAVLFVSIHAAAQATRTWTLIHSLMPIRAAARESLRSERGDSRRRDETLRRAVCIVVMMMTSRSKMVKEGSGRKRGGFAASRLPV
jgi:hypothetical protein